MGSVVKYHHQVYAGHVVLVTIEISIMTGFCQKLIGSSILLMQDFPIWLSLDMTETVILMKHIGESFRGIFTPILLAISSEKRIYNPKPNDESSWCR